MHPGIVLETEAADNTVVDIRREAAVSTQTYYPDSTELAEIWKS